MCESLGDFPPFVDGADHVLSDLTFAKRRQAKRLDALTSVDTVDMGIVLHVVERDPHGARIVPGCDELLREIGTPVALGGVVSISARGTRITGPSLKPRHLYASAAQMRLVLHSDLEALWQLVTGSEGAGKSTVLALWTIVRALEHVGTTREIGITAPTVGKLAFFKKAVRDLWDPRWYRFSERYQRYTFHAGPTVQMVSAVQRSEDGGSPIQGFNWVAHGGDELQDHFDRESDIQARGRSAPGGRYKRLNTSTFKDHPGWRTFRSACEDNATKPGALWGVSKLLGLDSPFVSATHWENLRTGGTMTPREYRRRVLAMEVGPESQLYHCWTRKTDDGQAGNLRPLPTATSAIHGEDVTAEILRDWGSNLTLLVGHDPGTRQHVSVFLKAYRFASDVRRGDKRPRWFVVDEVTSPDCTVESHVQEVLKRARSAWRVNEPAVTVLRGGVPHRTDTGAQMLVRVDPHTRSGTEHPGRDVFSIWRSFGILTRAAAYDGDRPAVIKKESRINLVNTLLCAQSAEGETRRLFVACTDAGKPLAERVVESFESMERDERGEAETEKKNRYDKSHWSAAVGYALWQAESRHVHRGAA